MKFAPMRKLKLPSGDVIPVLGQGTWHVGEDPHKRENEIAALRLGLELGMTLIDTAEMYGDGAAESLIGEAVAGRRDQVFLVSKVQPHHATERGTIAACEASLGRLRTDHLDLFLLHWREYVPIQETLAGFDALMRAEKIRAWGVSNFDLSDMQELVNLPEGRAVQTDQVLYNLTRRGIEWDLLPWCRERKIPIMAYSPVEQARLLTHPILVRVAERHGATPAQLALAWVLQHDGVLTVPKAATPAHVNENRAALGIELTRDDLSALDRVFPPPNELRPLETL